MMRRSMMPSLLERLAKSYVMRSTQSHSQRSLVSEKSYRYLGPSLFDVPALPLTTFSPMLRQHNVCFSNLVRRENENKKLEVEIISTEHIKPAAPTPKHFRTYELSVVDQLNRPAYVPFVYFYSNNNENNTNGIDLDHLTLRKRQLLKRSLSETLPRFYPLAGKVKDYRHIDCNDDGVYCVEAEARQSLSDFLSQPGNKSVQPLLPFGNNFMELYSKTNVLLIQITTFSCGGISIGLCASHRIIDGSSYATFLKAWAATAAGDKQSYQFFSPSVFTSTPCIPESMQLIISSRFLRTGKNTTKRFVFRASSLIQLKKKGGASRVLAVKGLIWKCVIKASKSQSTPNYKKSSAFSTPVNLRGRSSPPIPFYHMGNIISLVISQCSQDVDNGLEALVRRLKNSIDEVDSDYVEAMKGEKGSHKVREMAKETQMFYSDESSEHFMATSMCNSGMYEPDFGWGKPIWVSFARIGDNADPNIPCLTNFVLLMDTKAGNGIEAWVTLPDANMAIFERDPEMLEMALVDPSPLD